jgi:hypothetical protein
MASAHWFLKCSLSAGLGLLACGVATAWFGDRLQLPSVTTRDGTLITMNRYVKEPIPDLVLVGSSLTFRLKEGYFSTPRLRNLGLAGGSPLTGLEIVASQSRLPKIILVEANVLSRATDMVLVKDYSNGDKQKSLLFRPVRTAVAAYENWIHAPLDHRQISSSLSQLLKEPPSEFDNRIYVNRTLEQWSALDPTAVIQKNVTRIAQLIQALEQRGARVLLFELPCSKEIEASPFVKITGNIVHRAFSDPDQWLHIDYARDELRWADGVHLDERSAIIVTKSIEVALLSLLDPRASPGTEQATPWGVRPLTVDHDVNRP